MRSLAPDQSLCDASGLTTGTCEGFAWQPSGGAGGSGEAAFLRDFDAQPVHCHLEAATIEDSAP